jgi:predicted regulator of amino acid metabolism with ACT domain
MTKDQQHLVDVDGSDVLKLVLIKSISRIVDVDGVDVDGVDVGTDGIAALVANTIADVSIDIFYVIFLNSYRT